MIATITCAPRTSGSDRVHAAARRLYDAECALHVAHQTRVDRWIVTACQQACPTDTIVFGNINDPKSKVARLKAEPHDYGLLGDLNTQPRTSYLAKVKNPNPELDES